MQVKKIPYLIFSVLILPAALSSCSNVELPDPLYNYQFDYSGECKEINWDEMSAATDYSELANTSIRNVLKTILTRVDWEYTFYYWNVRNNIEVPTNDIYASADSLIAFFESFYRDMYVQFAGMSLVFGDEIDFTIRIILQNADNNIDEVYQLNDSSSEEDKGRYAYYSIRDEDANYTYTYTAHLSGTKENPHFTIDLPTSLFSEFSGYSLRLPFDFPFFEKKDGVIIQIYSFYVFPVVSQYSTLVEG